MKILGFIDRDSYLTPFGLWCIFYKVDVVEMIAVVCGADLF